MAVANESAIRQKLRAYIKAEIIKNPEYPLRDDEPLISGGLIDSFSIAHIAVFIETRIGVRIPDTDLTLDTMDSIDRMCARILAEPGKREER
ncbi:MAG TPA: acyl carrier protein [Acidobacteriota bacterium]